MSFLFWDWLLFNVLAVCLVLIILLKQGFFFSKRLIRYHLIVLLAIGFATMIYGSFIEPRIIEIKKETIEIQGRKTGQTIKVAFISDLHLGPYKGKRFVQKLVKKINREKVDLVLIAGDFVHSQPRHARDLKYLKSINTPMLAAMGNHDYDLAGYGIDHNFDRNQADHIAQALSDAGIKVLRNESYYFQNKLHIIGLEEYWTGYADLTKPYQKIPLDQPKIVIAHNPDIVQIFKGERIDLLMAGHTHAGQIRLPFLGPIGAIPTKLGQKFDHGFFTINGYQVYITGGLGESGPRARLFNPPEVVIFEINL